MSEKTCGDCEYRASRSCPRTIVADEVIIELDQQECSPRRRWREAEERAEKAEERAEKAEERAGKAEERAEKAEERAGKAEEEIKAMRKAPSNANPSDCCGTELTHINEACPNCLPTSTTSSKYASTTSSKYASTGNATPVDSHDPYDPRAAAIRKEFLRMHYTSED